MEKYSRPERRRQRSGARGDDGAAARDGEGARDGEDGMAGPHERTAQTRQEETIPNAQRRRSYGKTLITVIDSEIFSDILP